MIKKGDRVKLSKKKYTTSGTGNHGIGSADIHKQFGKWNTVILVRNGKMYVVLEHSYLYWPAYWFDVDKQIEFEF